MSMGPLVPMSIDFHWSIMWHLVKSLAVLEHIGLVVVVVESAQAPEDDSQQR